MLTPVIADVELVFLEVVVNFTNVQLNQHLIIQLFVQFYPVMVLITSMVIVLSNVFAEVMSVKVWFKDNKKIKIFKQFYFNISL